MNSDPPPASPFKRSRLSWFRCAYCGHSTYGATSRTILAKARPNVTVEYTCLSCNRISTLRNPSLMNVGLPFVVAGCAFVVLYKLLLTATSWIAVSVTIVLVIGVETMIAVALARVCKRFDKA